jgi:hypothetical protein
MVRAKRRQDLLASAADVMPDDMGKYKRRQSPDRYSSSVPADEERDNADTLVYLHQVKRNDTLAGVVIKYSCQPQAFRRANRFWPNDSIQSRKTVVLPVGACAVKGRLVQEKEALDLLTGDGPEHGIEEVKSNGTNQNDADVFTDSTTPTESSIFSKPTLSRTATQDTFTEEAPWRHDSWVLLPSDPQPVEIVRIPQRSLTHFPRSRRKSFGSTTTTSSFDLPRGPPSPVPPLPSDQAARRFSSFFEGSNTGIGRLTATHGIGPPVDGLNKWTDKNFPNIVPRHQPLPLASQMPGALDFPSLAALGPTLSLSEAPRPSFESISSNNSSGLENMGGAIEGWVRKMAGQAKGLTSNTNHQASSGGPGSLVGIGGIGDLIELGDASANAPSEEEERGRAKAIVDEGFGSARAPSGGLLGFRERGGKTRTD